MDTQNQRGNEMKNSLVQRTRHWTQGIFEGRWVSRFLLAQLTHTAITIIVLAALLLGVERAGALNGIMVSAPAATATNFTAINYQGRLADSSGNPINNTNPGLGIAFALYDVESGGSPVWAETHANVPVSDGLFSVRLGSVNALSTDLLGGDRWLGIQVGIDPEMTPREKLVAVPYAMVAGRVQNGSIGPSHFESGTVINRYELTWFGNAGDDVFETSNTSYTDFGRELQNGIPGQFTPSQSNIPSPPDGTHRQYRILVHFATQMHDSGEGSSYLRGYLPTEGMTAFEIALPPRWANDSWVNVYLSDPISVPSSNAHWQLQARTTRSDRPVYIQRVSFIAEDVVD
jgi:hypothetical protein